VTNVCKISQNYLYLAGDWSILLKFCTDFDHVTLNVPQAFKVNGSEVKVTA